MIHNSCFAFFVSFFFNTLLSCDAKSKRGERLKFSAAILLFYFFVGHDSGKLETRNSSQIANMLYRLVLETTFLHKEKLLPAFCFVASLRCWGCGIKSFNWVGGTAEVISVFSTVYHKLLIWNFKWEFAFWWYINYSLCRVQLFHY